jgi:hypothetical protein
MMSARKIRFGWLIWLAAALAGLPALALAQDFRIDTEIFVRTVGEKVKEKEPDAETLTIFTNNMIYDFLRSEPREITLFDPSRGRFTLLDETRELKTSLSTQDVLDYVLSFDSHATQSQDACSPARGQSSRRRPKRLSRMAKSWCRSR